MDCCQPQEKFDLQENFKLEEYCGTWYELYRTKSIKFESGTNIEANYTMRPDRTVAVHNKQYLTSKRKWDAIDGIATVPNASQPAHLKIKFKWYLPKGNYSVLYTDYNNIAIVYSHHSFCFGLFKRTYAWILGRNRNVSQCDIDHAFTMMEEKLHLEKSLFMPSPTSPPSNGGHHTDSSNTNSHQSATNHAAANMQPASNAEH